MGTWRGNSKISYSTSGGKEWGGVRLEGDDDLSFGMGGVRNVSGGKGIEWNHKGPVDVRNVGQGIEGRPGEGLSVRTVGEGIEGRPGPSALRGMRGTSNMSVKSLGKQRQLETFDEVPEQTETSEAHEKREQQIRTTLALLQTFHANTCFQLSQLSLLLPPEEERNGTIYLSAKDVLSLELGPFSSMDVKYLQWLAEEYSGTTSEGGRNVVVKRGWKDVLGLVLGFG